jgi:hypothetical protein
MHFVKRKHLFHLLHIIRIVNVQQVWLQFCGGFLSEDLEIVALVPELSRKVKIIWLILSRRIGKSCRLLVSLKFLILYSSLL